MAAKSRLAFGTIKPSMVHMDIYEKLAFALLLQ